MSWIDLLKMSSSNLKRRKLRTFLTVLGVLIGSASIVVMVSLGLGLQKSLYDEIQNSGGVTMVTVTGEGGDMYGGESQGKKEAKHVSNRLIREIKQMEHVQSVQPVFKISSILIKGNEAAYIELQGMTPEGLKSLNVDLESGGRLPHPGGKLELLVGNGVPIMFYNQNTGKGYYDTNRLPDINFSNGSMFLVLDQENYKPGSNSLDSLMGTTGGEGEDRKVVANKHLVSSVGLVEGGIDKYTMHYGSVYCDLETLKKMVKKEFSGRKIPGQPTTKSGKPYREFFYSQAMVEVDDVANVEAVAKKIRDMGYGVSTNAEFLESAKSQLAIVQAVLGGIGAVSLLVAAIGIANTMMMSIYERTKEIGVIKVLGCSLKNIKQMFLIESAFIGFFGGIGGNIMSILISLLINFLVGKSGGIGVGSQISYIPPWLMLVSMAFSIGVGVLSGYFPAKRAMQLSPLEAIRTQ